MVTNRDAIRRKAKELGHTTTETYGVLEVWNESGLRVAVFGRLPASARLLDAGEDILAAFPGATVISCK